MNEGITQQEIEQLLRRFERYLFGEVSLTTYSDGSMMLHRECVDMNESDDLMAFEDMLCEPEKAAEVGLHALYAYLIINHTIDCIGTEEMPNLDVAMSVLKSARGNLFVAKEALYLVLRNFLLEKGVEFLAAYERADQSNIKGD